MDVKSAAGIVGNLIERLTPSGRGYLLERSVTDREIEALISLAAAGGYVAKSPWHLHAEAALFPRFQMPTNESKDPNRIT